MGKRPRTAAAAVSGWEQMWGLVLLCWCSWQLQLRSDTFCWLYHTCCRLYRMPSLACAAASAQRSDTRWAV